MNTLFNISELSSITGGGWLGTSPDATVGVRRVIDDSRIACPGDLFVAIRGEVSDGHDYVDRALAAGATAVCVERDDVGKLPNAAVLRVPDTLRAYHALAGAHRRRFPVAPVVGITGSSGKTSVRAMLQAIFAAMWSPDRVLATDGNTNNHFGVPRNIFRWTPEHVAAVLEMGTSSPGEIEMLASMVAPNIGVITNIGAAHLEALGDLAGVAREKSSLFRALPVDGVAIMPYAAAQADILQAAAGNRRIITFGHDPRSEIIVTYGGRQATGYAVTLRWRDHAEEVKVHWALGGEHQALNAAAAAAAATAAGVPLPLIVKGLENCSLPGMRMNISCRQGIQWANDAYNANPDSVRAGIRWFRELTEDLPQRQCFMVLGDMLELGPASDQEHAALLAWVKSSFPADNVLAVGPRMAAAAAHLGIAGQTTLDDAREWLTARVEPGAWVLLKASRGMRLESLMPTAE